MTLSETVNHPAVKWTALVAVLVGLTQFNTGLKLVYSKWTADEAAADAKKVAEDAKGTADGVNARFDRYIMEQRQAIETQNKIAESIQAYAAQNSARLAPASGPILFQTFMETDQAGVTWRCDASRYDACWSLDDDGRNGWRRIE